MVFLNPTFLYFLPLTALPILIHLLGRRRVQSVAFSTLRFLHSLENQIMRRLKLRQILLLVLRTLLILVVILSLARPYRVQESPELNVRRGETLFLVIDNSASLQLNYRGATLFDYALDRIKSAARDIEFPINLRIVPLCNTGQLGGERYIQDREQLANELARLSVTNLAARPQQALSAAFEAIQKQQIFNASIWVVSDFQTSNWAGIKDYLAATLPRLTSWRPRLILLPVQAERDNIALSRIDLAEQILIKEEPIALTCTLNNWDDEGREAPLNLFLEQERVGQNLVQLPAGAAQEATFEFVLLQGGELSGWLEAGDDLLPGDNRFYFILNLPEATRVLLVQRAPTDGTYIIKALAAAGSTRVNLNTITLEQIFTQNLREYALVIFVNIDALPAEFTPRLREFRQNGGRLLLFLGDKCQEKVYNRYWAEQWDFPRWHQTLRSETGAYLALGTFRQSHPLFRDLWLREREVIDEVHFFVVPEMILRRSHQPLLFFSNQMPLLVETEQGLLLATMPNDTWTDWPLSGSFPALLLRLTQYLTTQSQSLYYAAGDTLWINPGPSCAPDLTVTTPSGRRIKLEFDDKQRSYRFQDTFEPGIYTVYTGARIYRRFAVNLPYAETTAGFWQLKEWQALSDLNPRQIGILAAASPDAQNKLAFGKEYEGGLLLLALVLVFGETFLCLPSRSKLE